MLQWRVVLLAAMAVLLLLAGLALLILPDSYEGRSIYDLDNEHAFRSLDILGSVLLFVGCILAWTAGVMWQRRMDASP